MAHSRAPPYESDQIFIFIYLYSYIYIHIFIFIFVSYQLFKHLEGVI